MFFEKVDRNNVLDAIMEFDDLGREKFLEKYGFRKALLYFVKHNGKYYDCKPLLWAAYCRRDDEKLDNRATGGIRKSIQPYLKSLGFEVIRRHPTLAEFERESLRKVTRSLKDSHAARLKRLASARKIPTRIKVIVTAFYRNPDVIAEVLLRATGKCESCGNPAPFLTAANGTPYLEVHHKIRLADGGEDTVANAMALCPNCHRKAHYGVSETV